MSEIVAGMTCKRFEDLPVWKDAIRLAEAAEDFLLSAQNLITRGKQDQLDRCSLSVSNNIAEGFERGTTKELLAFLYIARGSAGEVRSMMRFFERRPVLAAFKPRITGIITLAEACSRQIRAWADSLQNSEILGQRHLNDQSRQQFEKQQAGKEEHQKYEEMEQRILAKMADGHPFKEAMRKKGKI